jgi:hypothetical protein
MQWLKDPDKTNVDNLNVRREAGRHFKHKKNDNQKAKVYEVETNSKIKKKYQDL